MSKIITVRDAARGKREREAAEYSASVDRAAVAAAAAAEERAVLARYPEIGVMVRCGCPVFYTYVGADRYYVESTNVEAVASAIRQEAR